MKVLLDECVPRPLKVDFGGHYVNYVTESCHHRLTVIFQSFYAKDPSHERTAIARTYHTQP